jgi:hypothetical protein
MADLQHRHCDRPHKAEVGFWAKYDISPRMLSPPLLRPLNSLYEHRLATAEVCAATGLES